MIRIPRDLLADIHTQAEHAYPRECCGLLVGCLSPDGATQITRLMPSPNTASGNTKDTFEIDPQVRFDLMRDLADSPNDIVGHYHSHPDHPTTPSKTDLDMAFEPAFIWLITAVTSTHAERTQAWRLDQSTCAVQALRMDITESP